MSAEIIRLKVKPHLHKVSPATQTAIAFRQRETDQAEAMLDLAATSMIGMRSPGENADQLLSIAIEASEAQLFHLIMARGALEQDRELCNLLARRVNRRSQP